MRLGLLWLGVGPLGAVVVQLIADLKITSLWELLLAAWIPATARPSHDGQFHLTGADHEADEQSDELDHDGIPRILSWCPARSVPAQDRLETESFQVGFRRPRVQ